MYAHFYTFKTGKPTYKKYSRSTSCPGIHFVIGFLYFVVSTSELLIIIILFLDGGIELNLHLRIRVVSSTIYRGEGSKPF